jgi:hypothetical protein
MKAQAALAAIMLVTACSTVAFASIGEPDLAQSKWSEPQFIGLDRSIPEVYAAASLMSVRHLLNQTVAKAGLVVRPVSGESVINAADQVEIDFRNISFCPLHGSGDLPILNSHLEFFSELLPGKEDNAIWTVLTSSNVANKLMGIQEPRLFDRWNNECHIDCCCIGGQSPGVFQDEVNPNASAVITLICEVARNCGDHISPRPLIGLHGVQLTLHDSKLFTERQVSDYQRNYAANGCDKKQAGPHDKPLREASDRITLSEPPKWHWLGFLSLAAMCCLSGVILAPNVQPAPRLRNCISAGLYLFGLALAVAAIPAALLY